MQLVRIGFPPTSSAGSLVTSPFKPRSALYSRFRGGTTAPSERRRAHLTHVEETSGHWDAAAGHTEAPVVHIAGVLESLAQNTEEKKHQQVLRSSECGGELFVRRPYLVVGILRGPVSVVVPLV